MYIVLQSKCNVCTFHYLYNIHVVKCTISRHFTRIRFNTLTTRRCYDTLYPVINEGRGKRAETNRQIVDQPFHVRDLLSVICQVTEAKRNWAGEMSSFRESKGRE